MMLPKLFTVFGDISETVLTTMTTYHERFYSVYHDDRNNKIVFSMTTAHAPKNKITPTDLFSLHLFIENMAPAKWTVRYSYVTRRLEAVLTNPENLHKYVTRDDDVHDRVVQLQQAWLDCIYDITNSSTRKLTSVDWITCKLDRNFVLFSNKNVLENLTDDDMLFEVGSIYAKEVMDKRVAPQSEVVLST